MTYELNILFYNDILPNISDYIFEFGKAYRGESMQEEYNVINIVKPAATSVKQRINKVWNGDSTFKNKLKLIYLRKNDKIEYVMVGSDKIQPEMVELKVLEDLIMTLEDKSGVTLFGLINP